MAVDTEAEYTCFSKYSVPLYRRHDMSLNSFLYILIRSNKTQQYAGIYLLQNHSTCFGCPSHPSSGVHKTVTAASGTSHSNNLPPTWLGHVGGRLLLSLSWTSSIQFIPPHPTSRRPILILYSNLRLGLPSSHFPSGFRTKTLYTPLLSPYALHAPPISFFSILSPEQYWVRSIDH